MLGSGSGARNRLYLNDGDGFFSDGTAAQMPLDLDDTRAVALGDVDGDLDLDIALGNWGGFRGQQNRLYLNDGTGTFTDATAARMPVDSDLTWTVALGDVDGDNDLDIVFGNYRQNRVYTNLHRQLSTPVFPIISRCYDVVFHAKPGYASSSHTGLAVLGFTLSPVPLTIQGLGTFFLDPTLLFQLAPVAIPQATGTGIRPLFIPANPSLVGLVLYLQGLIVNNTTGEAHFTGFTADAIL